MPQPLFYAEVADIFIKFRSDRIILKWSENKDNTLNGSIMVLFYDKKGKLHR